MSGLEIWCNLSTLLWGAASFPSRIEKRKMTTNRQTKIISKERDIITFALDEGWSFPPCLFHHEEMLQALEIAQQVDKETLINMLNHIHFMEESILLQLRHPKYGGSILMRAYPEPCLGGNLACRLSNKNLSGLDLNSYHLVHLVIDDGRSMILVPAEFQEIHKNRVMIQLPQISYAVGQRQTRRYACHDVDAEIMQSGFVAQGKLLDFSPRAFRITVRPVSFCTFHWFDPDAFVIVHLRRNKHILFSGLCKCIRQQDGFLNREIVLTHADTKINQFKKRRIRNPRQRLVPPPTISFDHPFLNKHVQFEVTGISTSGFSVYESADDGILMRGMVIPELMINFAGATSIPCVAQVIYRLEEKGGSIRCGLAILDMDITSYSRLAHILTNALDPHAYDSSEVDMDALWEFFFNTGFIYPMKYRLIQSHREGFKEMYRKLYKENPEISRHFTYQKNGRIYGHISMIRAYERTWMIHHHAARIMDSKRPGFMVLKQIMYYMNDMYRLPSAHMDYVMCYFRPENRFPDFVFGGFARTLKNPQGCSMDLFSYLTYTRLSLGAKLPNGWSMNECSEIDLWELNRFYEYHSGGLLLSALALDKKDTDNKSLEELYSQLGFVRKRRVFALKHKAELNAVLIVNQSDLGFNLSELLNGIKILVTNPEALPWNILAIAISQLTGIYHTDRVPLLFYPFDYIKSNGIPYEKQYQAWVLNVQYGNEYIEYMQKKFRINYK